MTRDGTSSRPSWLVEATGHTSLDRLVRRLNEDPEVKIRRTIHLHDGRQVLVVEMSEETKERYRQQYEGQFSFEPNLEIHPSIGPSSSSEVEP